MASDAGGQFIRAYLPGALSVHVLARDGGEELGELQPTATPGLFVEPFRPCPGRTCCAPVGPCGEQVAEDPYSFGPLLGEMKPLPVWRG